MSGKMMSLIRMGCCGLFVLIVFMLCAHSEEWPACKFQCRANDVTVSKVWIGDVNGGELPQALPGQSQSCFLWATMNNLATAPRYAVILLADLYINGTYKSSFYDSGVCVMDQIPGKSIRSYPLLGMTWTRGESISLRRLVLSWETAKGTNCNSANRKCANRNTKCYGGGEVEMQVETPLTPAFSVVQHSCMGEVSFRDATTGGTGSYSYYWDFGDGTSSFERDPTHEYARFGVYDVALTVTDQSAKSSTFRLRITLNICPCTIVGEDHPCQSWTRSYAVVMDDPTLKTVHWHLDGVDMIENPLPGLYGIEIYWQNYDIGEHFLQAYVSDAIASGDPSQWIECNMTVNVIPEPLATITFSGVR